MHAAQAQGQGPAGVAIALALHVVARQLSPAATTFFTVDDDGMLDASVVHRPGSTRAAVAAVTSWKRALREHDPLAPHRLPSAARPLVTHADGAATSPWSPRLQALYRAIDVVNDVRMLVRVDGRLVGGMTLWRHLGSPRWTSSQLRALAALQPFVERAYVEATSDPEPEGPAVALLTPREREVARVLATGASNAEIAQALHVSAETAKSHTKAILGKLGVGTRRDAVPLLRPAAPSLHSAAEGRETADALLDALLRWARERIGGVAGGHAILSGRGEIVAHACRAASSDAPADGDGQVRTLHEALLTPAFLRRLANGWVPNGDVFPADAVHPREDRLNRLAGDAGCALPLLLVLRAHGRVAGVVWIACDRRTSRDQRGALTQLRGMRGLVEAACAPMLQRAFTRPLASADSHRRRLTPREWEVARAVSDGSSNEQAARMLGISEATVKAHLTRVLAKCGVRSRAQLIALLHER